jgi:hypothetical protein
LAQKSSTRSYAPSWVDRILYWIEDLPIPAWAFYPILYLTAALNMHLAIWINNSRPWGELSSIQLSNAIWLPLTLIVIQNTDKLARAGVESIAPLLKATASELDDLRYKITTMPASIVF